MGVHATHPEPRTAINAPDQCCRSSRRQAELRSFMTGQYVSVRVGSYARNDADQDILDASGRLNRLEPVDIVGAIDNDQPDATVDCDRDLFGGFGVSMKHDQRRIDAGLESGEDLAAAGHIEAKSLLDHDTLHCRAGERFRGKDDTCVGPPAGQLGDILSCASTERFVGDHKQRGSELFSKIIYPAPTDDQHPVGISTAARWQEIQ